MQVMPRTGACLMIVPAKLVKTVGVWQSSQASAAVPFGGLDGMWPVGPAGGCTSAGEAMLAKLKP